MVTTDDRGSGLEEAVGQVDGRAADLQESVFRLRTDLIAGLDRMEARLDRMEFLLKVILILTLITLGFTWVNLILLIARG